MQVNRGDVVLADLSGAIGHEIQKNRPCIVLSINPINRKPLVVTIVPGSSNMKFAHLKNNTLVASSARNGLEYDTVFYGHQVRALDQDRFLHRLGSLDPDDLIKVESAVRFSLGLL